MKIKTFSPVVVSLLVGAAIGFCLSPAAKAPAPEGGQKPGEPRGARAADDAAGERSSNRALRARIRELEGMLAKRGAEAEKAEDEKSAAPVAPRFDPRAEMERIKKEEPERYAQMTNAVAQFRRIRLERAQSKIDFLSSIDTSRMSPGMLKVHTDLQDMIERREAVEEKMRGAMDMSEDERRATFREMVETDAKIRELGRAERDNLLVQTAEAIGFQGDDAAELIDTVKCIYEATDTGWGFPGPGGPGGPGGRGGPGWRGGRGGGGPRP